ncbi:unnamed protein product [Triticum turgidum subsp. durum]|uniref:Uncharacterized protein n=1 Tax=Triticum turgidum subsp. durum TaxID=4567 RepID=A0A9R1R7L3_TRITD|nr:unnamed protein product [Triticum turgidum subsp. durum]
MYSFNCSAILFMSMASILRTKHFLVLFPQSNYGLQCHHPRQLTSKVHRYQVLDALVTLFSRANISADVRVVGGWLFRQLLPHGEDEFTAFHLKLLKVKKKFCIVLTVLTPFPELSSYACFWSWLWSRTFSLARKVGTLRELDHPYAFPHKSV